MPTLLFFGIVIFAVATALAVVVWAAYQAGTQNQIVDVFNNHTAEPLTAEQLSEESELTLSRTYKVLNQLDRDNRLRRIGIGTKMHYLCISGASS